MAKKNNKVPSIIDQSNPGFVATETKIQLSDEKLKRVLMQAYETALKNANAPAWNKQYGVFLSIAGSLFLAQLTSDFRQLHFFGLTLEAEKVTNIIWGIIAICVALCMTCLISIIRTKTKDDTEIRDKTIDQIFKKNFTSEE